MSTEPVDRKLKALWLVLKVAISFGFLYALIRIVDAGRLYAVVAAARMDLAAAAVLVFTAGQLLSGQRWRLILASADVTIPLSRAVRLNLVSLYASNFLPGMGSGDIVRPLYLIRSFPTKKQFLFASVIFDRLNGICAILILSGIGAAWVAAVRDDWRFLAMVACLILVLGGALVAARGVASWSKRLRWSPAFWAKLGNFVETLLVLARNGRLIAKALSFSILFQLTWVIMWWLCLRAVGSDTSIFAVFVAASLSLILAMVPLSLNGLGLREGAAVYMLAQLGVPMDLAISGSFLTLLPMILLSLLGGVAAIGAGRQEEIKTASAPK